MMALETEEAEEAGEEAGEGAGEGEAGEIVKTILLVGFYFSILLMQSLMFKMELC